MTDSPITQLPAPITIHQHIGRLYRELALLRRLLRLSQAAEEQRRQHQTTGREVSHGT